MAKNVAENLKGVCANIELVEGTIRNLRKTAEESGLSREGMPIYTEPASEYEEVMEGLEKMQARLDVMKKNIGCSKIKKI